MTPKSFWLNLPVSDMATSKTFYRAIGLTENERHKNNDQVGSFLIGEHEVVLMLFPTEVFASFSGLPVEYPTAQTSTLLNLGMESRGAVDQIAANARAAGGTVYLEPQLMQDAMYVCGFTDPDGHRWSVLFMDRLAS